MTESAAPPDIRPATALLSSALPSAPAGFAPLWFRHQRIGAIGPQWLTGLDPQLFRIEDDGSPTGPTVRLQGGDRRSESGLIPTETLNRRLAEWAERLRADGRLPGWRGEPVRLYGADESESLLSVERALLRPLGLLLRSVQLNVYTIDGGGLRVWVARRAAHKPVDPDCLDTLVGGGIVDDETPLETLVRECQEEAGIPRPLARRAVPVGVVDSVAAVEDGGATVLHRERLMLYDLKVPADFRPALNDGESASADCLDADRARQSIAAGGWTREGAWATADLLRRQLAQKR